MWPIKIMEDNNWRTKYSVVCLLLLTLMVIRAFGSPNNDDGRSASTLDTEKRATIIRRAFKQLLKVKSLPSVRATSIKNGGGGSGTGHHFGNQISAPPQYMLELYEKYRKAGQSTTGSKGSTDDNNRRGNTVRSIVAIKGNINGDQMLVFNISGIHSHEELLHGELHFYKRRKVKWHRKLQSRAPEYRIKVCDIASDRVDSLATVQVASRSHGWQVYDVTKMVKECRQPRPAIAVDVDVERDRRRQHHLLGIKFEGLNVSKRRRSKFGTIPLNKFVNMNSQPFLIVFTNDRANNTIDDLETTHHILNDDDDDDDGDDVDGEVIGEDKWHESATLLDDEDYFEVVDYEEDEKNQATNLKKSTNKTSPTMTSHHSSFKMGYLKRFSRSIDFEDNNSIQEDDYGRRGPLFDNELPDDSVQSNQIPRSNPGILQSRSSSNNNNNGRQRPSKDAMQKTIPYPATMTFGRQPHQAKKHRNNRKLPKAWLGHDDDQQRHQSRHENDATAPEVHRGGGGRTAGPSGTVCRKRKLVVDFADIGWGEWIISPKSFEAQYCSGACPFPLSKNLKPSNHATIQSIVHAIGLQPNVPAPCCVADTMSSITLLYFDEDRNVVLKNYPSMTVESCACR